MASDEKYAGKLSTVKLQLRCRIKSMNSLGLNIAGTDNSGTVLNKLTMSLMMIDDTFCSLEKLQKSRKNGRKLKKNVQRKKAGKEGCNC
ncbi:MAG: hypothetical protein ACLUVO_05710 [Roseburia sp.]